MSTSPSPAMNDHRPVANNGGDGRKRKAASTDSDTVTDDQVINNDGGGAGCSSLCCPCFRCQCGCHAMARMADDATAANNYDLDSLPTGYRFNPTDKELIKDYLLRKIKNMNLPKNKINEADIYGDKDNHPKNIVGNYLQAVEGEWYFFTSRNRKYKNGKRPDRSAGVGYWKATGPDKDIKDNDGSKIGGKKSLVYYEGRQPRGTKTDWMMQEFVVEGYERQRSGLVDMKLDDYVLCKIYVNKKGKKELKDIVSNQQANVVSYHQETNPANFQIENNVVIDQQSNFAIHQHHHHVDNNFPNQRLMNTDADDNNGVVLAYNQQAARPTILQVENNVVVQNYQNLGSFYGQMTPYTIPSQPVQMINFSRPKGPPVHHSYVTPSNHTYALPDHRPYLPPTPRKSAPPQPPRIENNAQHHENGHPNMYYSSGPNPNPPQAHPPAFQQGNDFDEFDPLSKYLKLMIAQDGNLFLDDTYGILIDPHQKVEESDESKKHEAPKAE